MRPDPSLLPGRLLRRPGHPSPWRLFPACRWTTHGLAEVLSPDAKLLCLYEGTLHAEGTGLGPGQGVACSGRTCPTDGCCAWHPDGHVEVALDGTYFMNGNALDAEGPARALRARAPLHQPLGGAWPAAGADRHALPGPPPEFAQRPHGSRGRRDLVHRPDLRHLDAEPGQPR